MEKIHKTYKEENFIFVFFLFWDYPNFNLGIGMARFYTYREYRNNYEYSNLKNVDA
tara:strand:- start:864 stop:1031 length:168 start_codon:yes stop_codon:yes gene_type:complete